MNSFKFYFRKSSFKKDIRSGNFLLKLISEIKPSSFLEIGVLEGVTSRNVCELLNKINNGKFNFIGIDLFGEDIEKNNKQVRVNILRPYHTFYNDYNTEP